MYVSVDPIVFMLCSVFGLTSGISDLQKKIALHFFFFFFFFSGAPNDQTCKTLLALLKVKHQRDRDVCVRACVRACVPACLRACVPACLRVCVCVHLLHSYA